MSVEMKAYDAAAQVLAELGAQAAFGLLGSGNFRIAERLCSRHAIPHYWARHECGVVAMADGYARARSEVGVCTLHQGPGLTHALTGLVEAAKAQTPMVVVCGDVATTAGPVNQRIDQDALVAATGAGVERISRGAEAGRVITGAWRRAVTERRPVVVSFPVDVQLEDCDHQPEALLGGAYAEPGAAAPVAIARAAELIAAARRPLVLGGRGAVLAGAEAPLRRLAELTGALLATTAPAKGLFAHDPWCVGIAGGFASPVAQRLLPSADLVLAFGASLNHWTTRHGELVTETAAVVACDDRAGAIGAHRRSDVALLGDARSTADALCAALEQRCIRRPGFRAALGEPPAADGDWAVHDDGSRGMVDPRSVLIELDARLPHDRTVVTDSGRYIGWVPMHMSVRRAGGFVFSQAFQSLGLGVATAVGAALARPDDITVAVVGDGGLMMSLGEIDAAVSHGVRLLIVVMDDGAYGAEVHHFRALGEPTGLVEFGTRDFAAIARALGAQGSTVRQLEDLDRGLAAWLSDPSGTYLLDCKIDGAIVAEWMEEAFRGGA